MSESLRKRLIFMTLPLALLYAGYSLTARKSKPLSESNPAYSTIQPVATAGVGATSVATRQINRDSLLAIPWGRDPFRFNSRPVVQPPRTAKVATGETAPKPVTPSWEVNGILYSDSDPIAYVNRKAVTVGQTVDNAKVVAISKTSVTLDYAGKRFTVSPR